MSLKPDSKRSVSTNNPQTPQTPQQLPVPSLPATAAVTTPATQSPQAAQPAPVQPLLAASVPAPQQASVVQQVPAPSNVPAASPQAAQPALARTQRPATPAPGSVPAQPPQAAQPAPPVRPQFSPIPPPNNPPTGSSAPSQGRVAYIIGATVILAFLALLLGVILLWPNKGEKESAEEGVSSSPTVSMTVAELDARLAEAKNSERAKVEVERPAPHPVESYGVATFRPTTTLNEMNSRNVPTISRTEAHTAPNGRFHLLYAIDPVLKTERMITAGGDTVTLLEPDWKTTRPKGKLVLLAEHPKGLRLPVGRHAVAIVEQ